MFSKILRVGLSESRKSPIIAESHRDQSRSSDLWPAGPMEFSYKKKILPAVSLKQELKKKLVLFLKTKATIEK